MAQLDQETMQAMANNGMAPTNENEGSNALLSELFQESYKIMYDQGHFDTMLELIESGEVPLAQAVAQLVSAILTSAIKDKGITDISAIYGLGLLLSMDVLDSLAQIGVEIPPNVMPEILSAGIGNVLADAPELIEVMKKHPEMQEALQAVQGGASPDQPMIDKQQGQQPQPQAPAGGVLGQAQGGV